MAEVKIYICDGCGLETKNAGIAEKWGLARLSRAANHDPSAIRHYGTDKSYDLCEECFNRVLEGIQVQK